mgnify:CR=1 FL=1
MKRIIITFLILVQVFVINAQEEKPKNWTLNGYVKNMTTGIFYNTEFQVPGIPISFQLDTFFQENLIHNRLNFKWFINDNWSFKSDLRNRIIFGDLVRTQEAASFFTEISYAESLDEANDYLNLSFEKVSKGIAIQSMIDRLYFEYASEKWEVRLGRQRINWGINTFWNPNDIFNAFTFTDFDYAERPGSDALRIRYFMNYASSVEVAVKAFDDFDEAVMAGLWTFNKSNYDFQILVGLMQRDLVFGGGWAGNLKNAGFKGEFSYFHSLDDEIDNSFAATFGIDYMFGNSLYLNGGFLFNSNGESQSGGEILAFELSAKNLYPYKWTTYIQTLYPFTQLINGGLAVLYSPSDVHALFINPTFTYSISENWDLDMVGQIVFDKNEGYKSPIQAIFLRTKFSF